MTIAPDPPVSGHDEAGYRLLQQELIATRDRLDRQITQLIRLNALSRPVSHAMGGAPLVETFAEAIVDVLDVGVGVAWIVTPHHPDPNRDFAVCGALVPEAEQWRAAGPALAELVADRGGRNAVRLGQELQQLLPGPGLHDVIACCCFSREGAVQAVLLAADTDLTHGAREPLGMDALQIFTLLAEKCADHIDTSADWQVIQEQVEQLRDSKEQLDLVLRGTNDGWWDWDLQRGTCIVSARWLHMLGHEDAVSIVRDGFWHEEIREDDRLGFGWHLERALTGEVTDVETEVHLRCRDSSYLPVLVRGTVSRDAEGNPTRFAGSILDLSERKRYEAHVHQLAFFDVLTELPNRRLLIDRIQQGLLAQERSGEISAILMLDLDRFKTLNDTHGHAAGDALLRGVAQRLRQSVRGHDTVARLGGDEFVVILEALGSDTTVAEERAQTLAEKILTALNEPYELEVGMTHHTASVGVALTVDPSMHSDMLLQRADVALYEAKAAGRNTIRLYQPDMQSRVDHRSTMEAKLREGFLAEEFHLWFQAQVHEDGRLYGAESLMRWHPGSDEPIPPSVFIPVAEDSGQIHTLGMWTMEIACRQAVLWRDQAPPGFRIAVNVSAPEYLHPDFPRRVLDVLERTGARGEELRLEITEANVVADLEFAAERMEALREHGLEFSLDDFGTGYSSLTYLRRLPVSEVKIDRSYVSRFLHDRHDSAILQATLMLCSSLDITVIAEGVETKLQRDRLIDFGCTHFQGYLYGRAVPAPNRLQNLLKASADVR